MGCTLATESFRISCDILLTLGHFFTIQNAEYFHRASPMFSKESLIYLQTLPDRVQKACKTGRPPFQKAINTIFNMLQKLLTTGAVSQVYIAPTASICMLTGPA